MQYYTQVLFGQKIPSQLLTNPRDISGLKMQIPPCHTLEQLQFDNRYRQLPGAFYDLNSPVPSLRNMFLDREAFDAWAERYAERLAKESRNHEQRSHAMKATNPKYILRKTTCSKQPSAKQKMRLTIAK